MVNRQNHIEGRHIGRHPLSDQVEPGLKIYSKQATVIAGQAQVPGIIETQSGQMTFQAGDYIVTDNPPTHAWPVRADVFGDAFAFSTDVSPGQLPTSEPFVIEEPQKSVPPHDTVDRKNAEMASGGRTIATTESLGMTDKKGEE